MIWKRKSIIYVSIPLRYAKNQADTGFVLDFFLFQFLLGTLKTKDLTLYRSLRAGFNSS